MGQDRQMQMVGGNGGNQFRQYAWQNAGNLAGYNNVIENQVNQNAVQNPRIQNVGNQNGLIGVQGNGNLVAARAEGNIAGQNGNQIRCYNYRGVGHYARNCIVRPKRRDAAYLQIQLLIAQKEEAGIQLQAEEYDLMAAVVDLDEIKEVNANCILLANLQQASTSGTQTDSAPVYDTNGSVEVHANCDNNEIFNMFTQEEQYTELLKPIPESHQVPQNDNDVISEDTSVEQGGEIVEQHPANFEETRALYESLYQNLQLKLRKSTRMTIETHNWASSAYQELHKIVREEIFPIINQVDARLQNFKIQFLKEATKFVGNFKSLAKEANDSLAKHKALELEIERLLKVVVSQDVMNIVQNESVVDTSDLQTELEHTRNPLSQKLDNENVELEFHVLNYARENAHLKATYKNLFDSISVSHAQTKIVIAFLQNELQSNIYKNDKLRTHLFKKVSDQKDNTQDTSANTKFAKQPIVENLPKIGKTNALSIPVTIAPGMFRINPSKTSREEKQVPNTVSASSRTKLIIVSQPPVITKKNVNFDVHGLSSTGVDNSKTRRPMPRSNTKNDMVPSASKSSQNKNKEAEVEEHHRNLLLSKNNKHISSAC
nr:hypothetical protein [Tanacetum cinerariifolium]